MEINGGVLQNGWDAVIFTEQTTLRRHALQTRSKRAALDMPCNNGAYHAACRTCVAIKGHFSQRKTCHAITGHTTQRIEHALQSRGSPRSGGHAQQSRGKSRSKEHALQTQDKTRSGGHALPIRCDHAGKDMWVLCCSWHGSYLQHNTAELRMWPPMPA